ncbi:MAG: 2-dehydropantoate 2-reductase [Tetrasphaera sp.]
MSTEPATTPTTGTRADGGGPGRTIAVLGAGGVGGLLAALLARAGHRVLVLAREESAFQLVTDGITVRSGVFGDFTATVSAAPVLHEPVDAVLVTVKGTALDEALGRVPARALGGASVVPFLNGFEHVATLRRRYPAEQVIPGTIRVESTRVAPGEIVHDSAFADIELAGPDLARAEHLAQLFRGAGLQASVADDENAMLWRKLAFLAPFAALTTRHRVSGDIVIARHRDELNAVVREIAAVAAAAGCQTDPDATVAAVRRFAPGAKSSMLRDAEAGRSLELDSILGAVLRAAEARGIPTPRLREAIAAIVSAPDVESR